MLKSVKFTIVIGLLGLLGACSGTPNLENRFAADPSLQNSPSPVNTPDNTGTTTTLPDTFPSDIPKYTGANLVSVRTEPDNNTVRTLWTSPDPANLIENFYQQQLAGNNWQIVTPFAGDGSNSALLARRDNLELQVAIVSTTGNTEFSIDYRPTDNNTVSSPVPDPSPTLTRTPTEFSDLDTLPPKISSRIQDLARLGALTGTNNRFDPKTPITRREFANWLVSANNAIYADNPGKQIRPGDNNSQGAFTDVRNNDPDFPYIQGLAEAGLIPSSLTGDSGAFLFRPDATLTREDLIAWKVPLDLRKALPSASLDTIKQTWGFQDTNKINPAVARALYADFQNGDQANIRRVYGFTTLFQPKKPVTREEAALALWYFGFQGDGLSAADALQNPRDQQGR